MISIFVIVLSAMLFSVSFSPSARAEKYIQACNSLAGHPLEPGNANQGVIFDKIVPDKAIAACRNALQQNPNSPVVKYRLGRALSAVHKYKEAIRLYFDAANQGYVSAQTALGFMSMNGQGVQKDYRIAFAWYHKAADQGDANAQIGLGYMYTNGLGVTKNPALAMEWYRKAEAGGKPSGFQRVTISRKSTVSLAGSWKGKYFCNQGWTGVTLTIQPTGSFNYQGNFRFYTLPGNPRIPSGEILYTVSYNGQTRTVNLSPESWIKRPRGYKMIAISGTIDHTGNRFSGKVHHRKCGAIILVRDSLGNKIPHVRAGTRQPGAYSQKTKLKLVVTPPTPPVKTAPIVGKWEGLLSCPKRQSERDMTLHVSSNNNKRFTAILNAYYRWSSTGNTMSLKFVGEYDPSINSYFFVRTKEIHWSITDVPIRQFTISKLKHQAPIAKFSKAGCDETNLSKISSLASSRNSLIPETLSSGIFFSNRSMRKRCFALVNWVSRLQSEYSKSDKRNSGKDYSLLFSDSSFIPLFGKAYDAFSPSELNSIFYEDNGYDAGRLCSKDPLIQVKMELADNVLRHGFAQVHRTVGGSKNKYISRQVQKNRLFLNTLKQQNLSDHKVSSFENETNRLVKMRNSISNQSRILWPSERKQAEARIGQHLSSMAIREIVRQIAEITSFNDPNEGLSAIKEALSSGVNGAMKYLGDSKRLGFHDEFVKLQSKFGERFIAPHLASLQNSPETLEGVRKIDALIKSVAGTISLMGKNQGDQYRDQFKTHRNATLKKLVDAELDQLRSFPQTKAGLFKSSAWIIAFNDRFHDFSYSSIVGDAATFFRKNRNERLLEAIPEFEEDLKGISLESPDVVKKVQGVFRKYISDSFDEKLNAATSYRRLVVKFSNRLGALGEQSHLGKGARKDIAVAIKWYRKASDLGNIEAQYRLGVLYSQGQGISKNSTEAMRWFKKAGNNGHAEAQYQVGIHYFTGNDNSKAAKWFQKAADQGHAASQSNLGIMYLDGLGVQRNEEKGIKLVRRAAKAGNKNAEKAIEKIERAQEKRRTALSRIKAPNEYRSDMSNLINGKPFRMNNTNLPFMTGVATALMKKCDVPQNMADRLELATFVKSGFDMAVTGNDYSNPNLGEVWKSQFAANAKVIAGIKTGEALGCRGAETIAGGILKAIRSSEKGADGGIAPFIKSCTPVHSKIKCECLAKLGRAAFPDIYQRTYSGNLVGGIVQRTPMVGLQIAFICQIMNY